MSIYINKESKKVTGEKVKIKNKYDLTHEYGIGYTCNTNKIFYFDLEDYDLIKDYHWTEKENTGYVRTVIWKNNKPNTVLMHRLIMEHYENINKKDIDHMNHKTNDNRKSNLRACEHYQNIISSKTYSNNTSGRKGVYWDKARNKWAAWITIKKKHIFIGRFDTFDDAVKAREKAEEKYHKEYHYKK